MNFKNLDISQGFYYASGNRVGFQSDKEAEMTENVNVLVQKATHILHVLKKDGVIAFSDDRSRTSLDKGSYPCFYIQNPFNKDFRALKFVNADQNLYVSEHFLEGLSEQLWRVDQITSEE